MSFTRSRAPCFTRAVALASCIVVPSSMMVFAACAASDETGAPDADSRVIVPSIEAGDEASSDAGAPESGTEAVPCAVGNLCSTPTPLARGAVTAMNGRSKNDVWASGTGGLLMHWNGQEWTALDSGVDEAFSSIFLTSDETWAIAGMRVLRRTLDPSSVRTRGKVHRMGCGLSSIAVLANGDAYLSLDTPVFAPQGLVRPVVKFDFDTGALTDVPGPFLPSSNEEARLWIRASFMVPDKSLWIVGDRGTVARLPISVTADGGDGGAPSLGRGVMVPMGSQADLLAAWGSDEQLWAAGRNGTVLHFDGAEWHTEETGTKATLNAIFGISPKDIWTAGDDGTVLHFDGNSWSPLSVGAYRGNLKAIWGSAADDVWIGGEREMFHWGALP